MPKYRYKLCDDDRARFGGEEWYELDLNELQDAPAGDLEQYERATGVKLGKMLDALNGEIDAAGLRAVVWIARHRAGLREDYRGFQIKTLRLLTEFVPDEAPEGSAPLEGSTDSSGGSESTTSPS